MILQRIATSIRKQDWFTVAVETLIVVFGVFIGLQVNNWNEARQDRTVEAQLIERLRQEVPALMASRSGQRGFNEQRREALHAGMTKLFTEGNAESLSRFECLAITISHVYSRPPDDLPVLDELKSTGRMDIIRDSSIRSALSRFVLARDRGRATQSAVSIDIHQLGIEYPDLITSTYVPATDEDEASAFTECDASGMRENRKFLNTLIGNQQRFDNYYVSEFTYVEPEIQALRQAVSGDAP